MTLKLVALTSLNGSDPMPMVLGQKVVRLQLIDTSAKQVPGKPYLFKDDHGRLSYLPPEPQKEAKPPAATRRLTRVGVYGALHGSSLADVGLRSLDVVQNMGAKGLMPDHPGWYAYEPDVAKSNASRFGKSVEQFLKFKYWDGQNWSVYATLRDQRATVARVKTQVGDSISDRWYNLEMVFSKSDSEAERLGLV